MRDQGAVTDRIAFVIRDSRGRLITKFILILNPIASVAMTSRSNREVVTTCNENRPAQCQVKALSHKARGSHMKKAALCESCQRPCAVVLTIVVGHRGSLSLSALSLFLDRWQTRVPSPTINQHCVTQYYNGHQTPVPKSNQPERGNCKLHDYYVYGLCMRVAVLGTKSLAARADP